MAWNTLKNFKFWANKVLPLVYDDSLSYYEVLCKVVDYINKIIENENEIYEMYDPFVQAFNTLQAEFEQFKGDTNTALATLNERCTEVEEHSDENLEIMRQLVSDVQSEMDARWQALENQYYAVYNLCTSLEALIKSGDAVTLLKSKQYTDDKVFEIKKWIIDPKLWFVTNPLTGHVEDIQTVINQIFDIIGWTAFTCWEFDEAGYDCDFLDGFGYTALDFDMYGRFLFKFGGDFVTADALSEYAKLSQLEHYALKTDLEPYALKKDLIVYNPVNGLKNTIQQVIDTLITFHANGNNCYTLDGLEYTATEYDGIGYTAYEFDFEGLVRKRGIYISPVTGEILPLQDILNQLAGLHQLGLTATQFDGMEADCDTLDTLEYTAQEFDFFGINVFVSASMITVVTGITAEQYQNIVADEYGTLRVLDI